MLRIDLHTHSNRSDGKESPSQVAAYAAENGLDFFSLSDHDTASGWDEAAAVALERGVGFVPGIELTTLAKIRRGESWHRFGVHLLAYLPDPEHPGLKRALQANVEARDQRAQAMVESLATEYDISWQLVLDLVGDPSATIGRPAIADALVKIGAFETRDEVFVEVLAEGSPHFIEYIEGMTPELFFGIETVLAAGGVPILAHPLARNRRDVDPEHFPRAHFEDMIDAGLKGFEVYHRDVPEAARRWLLGLAERHELIVTGSSDYHGLKGKLNRLGENLTDPEMLARIEALGTGSAISRPS